MKFVELYGKVRYAVQIEGISRREAARRFGIAPRTVAKMGLEPIYQRPRTTVPHPDHQIYPYLLREMVIERPNQVWCADITYIPMRCGFLYLVAVMDWARLLKVPSALPME